VKSKCLPILLYGLKCCSLLKADLHSLDFVVMRFLMKLFRTANKDIIDECRSFCNFPLPTEMLEIKSKVTCATKQIERDSKDTDATNSCPRKVQIKLFRNTLQK